MYLRKDLLVILKACSGILMRILSIAGKIVPSHWRAFSLKNQLLLPQKLLIFGGETFKPNMLLK